MVQTYVTSHVNTQLRAGQSPPCDTQA